MAFPFAILALVWTVLLFIELAVKTPPRVSEQITRIDALIWFLFALDFLVELIVAPDKRRYLRVHVLSAVGLVLPFFRALELVRLAALLRTTSLLRILLITNRAARGAARLFQENRFGYVAFIFVATAFLGAGTEYFLEQGVPNSPFQNFWTALWWSLALLTTVPAQVDPVTPEGQVVGLIVRVVALAVGGYVTGSIASYLIGKKKKPPRRSQKDLAREIAALRVQLAELGALSPPSALHHPSAVPSSPSPAERTNHVVRERHARRRRSARRQDGGTTE